MITKPANQGNTGRNRDARRTAIQGRTEETNARKSTK